MLASDKIYTILSEEGIDFFIGVPDSTLKSFSAYLTQHAGDDQHVICANEGSAVGVAIGYHLSTGKTPLVYLQNSGLGNAVNPLISLADREIYSIPILLMIGWRGEPGTKDEPQHVKMGRVMIPILQAMEIPYEIIPDDINGAAASIQNAVKYTQENNTPFALIFRPGMFDEFPLPNLGNLEMPLSREEAIILITECLDESDIVLTTTGMASRELYELRESEKSTHNRDFLAIGGMGHVSQIALGIAMKLCRRVICIDGDGSFIMHMGGITTIGVQQCKNLLHIVLNNGVHGSVGGQPTAGFFVDISAIAAAVGYRQCMLVETSEELRKALNVLKRYKGPSFLEIRLNTHHRKNLGRPNEQPRELKARFMKFLQ